MLKRESLIMALKEWLVSSGSGMYICSLEPSYVLLHLASMIELQHSSIPLLSPRQLYNREEKIM